MNEEANQQPDQQSLDKAVEMFGCLTTTLVFDAASATGLVAKALDLDEQSVRKAVKKHRIAVNQSRQSLP
jgi:hypothetical protein